MSEYINQYSSRISRVSEPAHFQSIFLHTRAGFPEYLSQYTFKAYSCIQQQDIPSIWASGVSEYACIHTAAGFPEYLSQWSARIYTCMQQQDFPSIWASTLLKHILAYSGGDISRVYDPVNFQHTFIHTAGGFPEYLSQWSVRIYDSIQQQDFPSIWASILSKHIPACSSRISRVSEPAHF